MQSKYTFDHHLNEGKMKRNIIVLAITAALLMVLTNTGWAQLVKVKVKKMTVQG